MDTSSAFQLVPEFFSLQSSRQQLILNALKLDKADYLELINYMHYKYILQTSTMKRILNTN